MTDRPRTSLKQRLVLLLVAALLALLGLEIVARVRLGERFVPGAHTANPLGVVGRFSPRYGWENRPSSRAHIVARRFGYDFEYTATINADGLRGPAIPEEKPEGVRRILLLGDSVGWGWGVDDHEAFPVLMQERLGPTVQLVNASVPGWGTDQQLLWLQENGARWQPDLVLLCFVSNDIGSNLNTFVYGMNKPRFKVVGGGELELVGLPVEPLQGPWKRSLRWRLRKLAGHSALARWFLLSEEAQRDGRPPYMRLLPPESFEGLGEDERNRQQMWGQLMDDVRTPRGATFRLLGKLNETCEELGAPLVAFEVPHHHDQYLISTEHPLPEGTRAAGHRTILAQALAIAGRRHGFATHVIDPALYRAREEGTHLDCGDGHLNVAGNEVVAEEMATYLVEHYFPEARPR